MQSIMKSVSLCGIAVLIVVMSACNANSSASPDANIPSSSSATGQSINQPSADRSASSATASSSKTAADTRAEPIASVNGVSKGMAYADFRKALLAQGWQPVVDHKCKANVVGGAYEELCAKGSDSCKACDELPELSACSGDAECVMNFQHADKTLQAGTYGDIADRNIGGKDSQLNVTGWKITSTPAHWPTDL
jgi:hypothetical protein